MQVMQNKAAQVVCCMPSGSNRDLMFDKLGWMTVNQMIVYYTLLTVFRIRLSNEPEYLSKILGNDSRNGRILLPRFDLSISQKSFTYRGANEWNKLPEEIRRYRKSVSSKQDLRIGCSLQLGDISFSVLSGCRYFLIYGSDSLSNTKI